MKKVANLGLIMQLEAAPAISPDQSAPRASAAEGVPTAPGTPGQIAAASIRQVRDPATLADLEGLGSDPGGGSYPEPADVAEMREKTPFKGPSFLQRLGASFKLTPEGKASYYEEVLPELDAAVNPSGDVRLRDPRTGVWDYADPDRLESGDIADLGPDAVITAATLGSGQLLGQGLKAAVPVAASLAARAGAASAANQAAGAALPGEEDISLGDRFARAGTDIGATIVGEALGGKMVDAVNRFRPKNIAATTANSVLARPSSFATPFAQEGQRLSQDLGVDLTPGAVTGQKQLVGAENMARQSIFSREEAFAADEKIGQQFTDAVNRTISQISNGHVGAEQAGNALRTAIKDGVEKVQAGRQARADFDYGQVRQLAGGGDVRMSMDNTVGAIDSMLRQYDGVATPEASKIVSTLKGLRERFSQTVPAQQPNSLMGQPGAPSQVVTAPVSLDDAMKMRSYFGKAQAGSGNIFNDLAMNGASRRMSRQIFAAMSKDFDSVPQNLPPNAVAAFKQANANYGKATQQIEFMEKSPLARLMGEDVADTLYSGESRNTVDAATVADRFRKLKPNEVATVRDITARENPEGWNQVRAWILQDALEKGAKSAPSKGARTIPMNPAQFVNALPDQKVLEQIFPPGELAKIKDIDQGLRRWADSAGFNFSGTGPYTEAINAWNTIRGSIKGAGTAAVAGGTAAGAVGAAVGALAGGVGTLAVQRRMMQGIAHAMTTPQGRTMLMELTKANPTTRRGAELVGAFSALYLTGNEGEDDADGEADGSGEQGQERPVVPSLADGARNA